MTGRHGQRFCAHSFRGTHLLLGGDSAIVGSDDEPAWLGVPGSFFDRRSKDGALGRTLNCEDEALLRGRKILSETLSNPFFCEHQVAVLDLPELAVSRSGWILRGHSAERFAFLGSEGRDVDHTRDFGIVSGFGDHCSAVRVADT